MIARKHLLIAGSLFVIMWLMSAAAMPFLPASVPMHWDINGMVDRYGSRWELALLLPIVSLLMLGLMIGLPLLGPLWENFTRFPRTYGRIVILFAAFMLALHAMLLLVGLGLRVPVIEVVMTGAGLLLAVLGNWFGKIRRNFWIGIRTPWTLANDAVWERTHRIGGRLLVVYGAIVALLGIAAPTAVAVSFLIGGLIILVMWSMIYSQWLFRRLGSMDDI